MLNMKKTYWFDSVMFLQPHSLLPRIPDFYNSQGHTLLGLKHILKPPCLVFYNFSTNSVYTTSLVFLIYSLFFSILCVETF